MRTSLGQAREVVVDPEIYPGPDYWLNPPKCGGSLSPRIWEPKPEVFRWGCFDQEDLDYYAARGTWVGSPLPTGPMDFETSPLLTEEAQEMKEREERSRPFLYASVGLLVLWVLMR